jgi:hypothetical protein
MPLVQLKLQRYRTDTIGSQPLHLEQVLVWMRIARRQPPHVLREAVVDTGAPMTVFPQREWQLFEQEISWLTALNDPSVPRWCRQFSGVAGGAIPCRLGTMSIEFFDHVGGWVGPTPIVAMFAFDHGQMRDILVGLGGGPFTRRRLEMIYDTATISLSDI